MCFQCAKDSHKEWFAGKAMCAYTEKCFELCWYMNLQSPPVYMDLSVKEGDKFNKETYKHYTSLGKKVAYVVWPALYLHEGGPLLAKGVAQGRH